MPHKMQIATKPSTLMGGRYVNVSDVQVEGHKIIITLSEDDL